MLVQGENFCMIDYVTKTLNLPFLLFDKITAPRCRADPSLYQLC